MSTRILRPLANGSDNNWVLGVGASKVAAVDTGDPVTHDDNSTYISNSQVNNRQSFTLTPVPSIGVVNSVSVGSRMNAASASGNSGENYVYLSGSRTNGTSFTFDGTWRTQAAASVSRPGGGSWAPDDIPSTQMGVRYSAGAPASCKVTSIWVVLDYYPPSGGFFFLLASWLPPVAGALDLAHMPRVAGELYRRTGTLLSPAEYGPAFREWNAWRRPAFGRS